MNAFLTLFGLLPRFLADSLEPGSTHIRCTQARLWPVRWSGEEACTQQAQPETNLDVAAAKMKAGVTVKGKGQRQMMVAGVKAGRSSGDRKAAL